MTRYPKSGKGKKWTALELKAVPLAWRGDMLSDGDGLTGEVRVVGDQTISIHFKFAFKWNGKVAWHYCGTWPALSMEQIRRQRDEARDLVRSGVNLAFGLNLARLQATGRPIGQPVLGCHQTCFELGQQGIGVLCRVPLAGRKIQVTRESGAVVADGQEQPALHHHPGLQILRMADAVQDDVHRLAEPALIGWRRVHPGFDVDLVHKASSAPPGIRDATLIESFHFSE